MSQEHNYYKAVPVLIVGESGTGKSTAIRTLPPKETVVLNTEMKALPMRNHNDFKVVDINSYKVLDAAIRYYASEKGNKYKYIVLDSFTSMTEIVDKYTQAMFSGFDQWKQYNMLIYDIINRFKQMKQQVFILGIPEQKDESFGETRSYLKVRGKELKYGGVEKEFAIILFTNPIYDMDTGEMEDVEFIYRPNKKNTAKAPVGMFTTRPKNDAMEVARHIQEYYKDERNDDSETGLKESRAKAIQ